MTRSFRVAAIVAAVLTVAVPAFAQRGRAPVNANNAISGRITDKFGRPVPRVFVTLLRERPGLVPELRELRHQNRFTPANVQLYAFTDGMGVYSLVDLSPGSYVIVAIPMGEPTTPAGLPASVGWGTTYYPSASTADTAKLVIVGSGQPIAADVVLNAVNLGNVTGTVVRADGSAVGNAALHVAHGDGLFGLASWTFMTKPDGSFEWRGVPPGTYFLRYNEDDIRPVPAGQKRVELPRISGVTVVMDGQSLSGVRVQPIKPAIVSGRVVVKLADGAQPLDVTTLRVSGFPFVSDGNPGPQLPGAVNSDATFEFQTWPALGAVRVFAGSREIVPDAARLKGVDVTKTGIDFVAGAKITGVEVEITIK